MRMSHMLLLSILLMGFYQAYSAPSPPSSSASVISWGAGEVPESHLRMLSLGLSRLLRGVEENVLRVDKQGDLVESQLEDPANTLEGISKQSKETRRTHKQVRKELQILSAKGDGLWRAVSELQKVLAEVESDQGNMQQRMDVVLLRGEGLAEPRSAGPTETHLDSVKILIEKQAGRIGSLVSEIVAQDRLINRRLQHIKRLEKKLHQVSESRSASSAEGERLLRPTQLHQQSEHMQAATGMMK